MKLRLTISALCFASIAMAGCASKVTQPEEYSGFLSDYSQLKEAKSPSGAEVMRWVDPKLDLSRYTAVYVEPTQFYPKPQATAKIPESTLNGINTYYNQAPPVRRRATVTRKPPWAPRRSSSTVPAARCWPKWCARAPASHCPTTPK